MTEHVWEIEEVNGGHLGAEDFYICRRCGASGGPVVFGAPPTFVPFYADGSQLEVSDDCEEALKQIIAHKKIWRRPITWADVTFNIIKKEQAAQEIEEQE